MTKQQQRNNQNNRRNLPNREGKKSSFQKCKQILIYQTAHWYKKNPVR